MKLVIPQNFAYQLLFVLCIAVPYLDIFELTFFVWSLAFVLTINIKYSVSLLKLILPYVAILIIAFVVSFRFDYQKFYVFRDITYLSKPIIGFFLGYQLCKKNFNSTLKLVVNTGVIIAVCHILIVISAITIHHARTVADLRFYAGYFSDYETYVFVILLFYKKFGLEYSRKQRLLFTILVGFSALMYLARTNFIQFVILFLALKGYFVINKRSIAVIGSILLFSMIGYSAVLYVNPKRSAEGIEGFLYKIKVAPMEPFKSKVNRHDWKEFNDNYRSYENIMTVRQVTSDGLTSTLFGKGLGSKIDLKQEVYLGDMRLRFISILHNGFMIVFLKSGLLGILIYLTTFFYFFRKVNSHNLLVNQINLLFLGTGIFLFISNWVFLGFYNLTETKSILIGFLIAFRGKFSK